MSLAQDKTKYVEHLYRTTEDEHLARIADLNAQIADLQSTITSLNHVGAEKDGIIMALRKENAKLISKKYGRYGDETSETHFIKLRDDEEND